MPLITLDNISLRFSEKVILDEINATSLLLIDGSSIDVLLVGVGLAFELHQFRVFETFPNWPLDDFAIARDWDQTLTLVLFLNPLNVPHDVSVLKVKVFWLGNRSEIMTANVVDRNVATGVANSNQVWWLLAELTASDASVVDNHLLREIRVLEGPEAEQTWLELAVINAVNVELTIANSNKVSKANGVTGKLSTKMAKGKTKMNKGQSLSIRSKLSCFAA
mgnify:CR=1 FL=1